MALLHTLLFRPGTTFIFYIQSMVPQVILINANVLLVRPTFPV